MKCWKCGQEMMDGAGRCPNCGAGQARPTPTTEAGRALRKLYDRYGCRTVLENKAYLVNGFGDLMRDSKKLRNQLNMAMDAGLGKLYLEQLNIGAPDTGFDGRAKRLLVEEAGLNAIAAGEIAGYFDEMIGWRAASSAQPTTGERGATRRDQGPAEVDRTVARDTEVDRGLGETNRVKEIDRRQGNGTEQTVKPQETKIGWKGLFFYEKATIICIAATLVIAPFINQDHDPQNISDLVINGLMLIPLLLSLSVTKDMLRQRPKSKGPVVLTVCVFLMLVFAGFDLMGRFRHFESFAKYSVDISDERYQWQQHLAQGDGIFLATDMLLLIQMIRHRRFEGKDV